MEVSESQFIEVDVGLRKYGLATMLMGLVEAGAQRMSEEEVDGLGGGF